MQKLCILILPLISVSILSRQTYGHEDDECDTDDQCNGTSTCCHRRSSFSICKASCLYESCTSSWDCGTTINLRCCSSDNICRKSYDLCPENGWPTWVLVLVILSAVLAVFGIAVVTLGIYLKHRRISHSRGLLAEDSLTSSAYSVGEKNV